MPDDQKNPNEIEAEAEIERELQAQIERELQAEMAKKRFEIARRLRREAEMKEYDRINAKAPIEDRYSGLGPEGYARRQEVMAAAARKTYAEMDAANARWAERQAAERKVEAARRGLEMRVPGSQGFRIKPIGT